MFHVIVNANLIVQQVIQINNGITINVNVSARNIIVEILAQVLARIVGI